jgi:hypothetical protein
MFPKKLCFVPLKCEGAKNLFGSYPTEFADSTQNPKKNDRSTKSTNQKENFPKKSMFSSKCKGAKNSYGGYPIEFAPGA